MAIMENSPESDVMRIMGLLQELSEQLSQNRNASIALHTVTGGVKTQSIHSQTGFVLRRFNQDKSQEEYNAELERMNLQMSAENLALQNDNKQLNALIKEYEQTLENLMTTFRNRANEVQQRELAIMRDYERKILVRETEELAKTLDRDSSLSASLSRVGQLLRGVLRILGGEDPASVPPALPVPMSPSSSSPLVPQKHILNALELDASNEGDEEDGTDDHEEQLAAAEWALERECELTRLELENRLLKQLVAEHEGVLNSGDSSGVKELPKVLSLPKAPARTRNLRLGGKDVGPFGLYKKFEAP